MRPANSAMSAPDEPVWKSYVWYGEMCFFVSTIRRDYDTSAGIIRGLETIVWTYDWEARERGEALHQSCGDSHQQICLSLISTGGFPA